MKIDAIPDLYYTFGILKADISINCFNGSTNYNVKLYVFDIQGNLLTNVASSINPQASYRSYENPAANTARINIKVKNIKQLTPETPTLYKAVMTLICPTNE